MLLISPSTHRNSDWAQGQDVGAAEAGLSKCVLETVAEEVVLELGRRFIEARTSGQVRQLAYYFCPHGSTRSSPSHMLRIGT